MFRTWHIKASQFFALHPFDLVKGVVVDYLHCVLLGVCKDDDGVLVPKKTSCEATLHWQEGIYYGVQSPFFSL